MSTDYNKDLADAIKRFNIKHVGCLVQNMIPYVVLNNGLLFYGLPVPKDKIVDSLVNGIFHVIKDIEYRYLQVNRELKQHTKYDYQPGDVVVEIGAYLGYYSMYAAQQVGSHGKVLAVELVPDNFELLKMNLGTNFPKNSLAINKAICNRKGIETACIGGNQIASLRKDVVQKFVSDFSMLDIETDTVDNILKENDIEKVDLMIIQVNGNEIDVLDGMSESLENVRNISIAAPYSESGTDHISIISEYLMKNNFDVEVVDVWIYAKRSR